MGGECGLRGEIKLPAINHHHTMSTMCQMNVDQRGNVRKLNTNTQMLPKGKQHYIEKFSVLRMNAAGFIFGTAENIMNTPGWDTTGIANDEASLAQEWSVFNHKAENFS